MATSRVLRVVEINDEGQSRENVLFCNRSYATHFLIKDPVPLLESFASGQFDTQADILLVDIDMAAAPTSAALSGMSWGVGQGTAHEAHQPYGPLLALPFLNSTGPMAMVVFSGMWLQGADTLLTSGFVALALTMIDATTSGTAILPDEYVRRVTEEKSEQIDLPENAAKTGFLRFRARVKALTLSAQTGVLDCAIVQDEVSGLLHQSDLRVPWKNPRGEHIAISFQHAAGNVDSIRVHSLYGDFLDFQGTPTKEAVSAVFEDLNEWFDKLPDAAKLDRANIMYERVKAKWEQIQVAGRGKGKMILDSIEDAELRRHIYNVAWLRAHLARQTDAKAARLAPATIVRRLLRLGDTFKLHRLFFRNDNHGGVPHVDTVAPWAQPYPENWQEVAAAYADAEPDGTLQPRPLSWFYYLPNLPEHRIVMSERELVLLHDFATKVFQWNPHHPEMPAWPKWMIRPA